MRRRPLRSFFTCMGLSLLVICTLFYSCGEPVRSAPEEALLTFSADTLRLDTLYSRISSATHRLLVYNRNNAAITLDEVALSEDADSGFRINVDGHRGRHFQGIQIADRDSMYIFVEATFPEGADDLPTLQEGDILLKRGSRLQKIHLEAFRLNTDHVTALVVTADQQLAAHRPLFIRDSIFVAAGATLTIPAGSHLLMSDKARIIVEGTLHCMGSAERRILIEGVRRDDLVKEVNYRLLPGQWEGLYFAPGSSNNQLHYTTIRNGRGGLILKGSSQEDKRPDLLLDGCQIQNMKVNALKASDASLEAVNCELSNTQAATVALGKGDYHFLFCTIANYYLFDFRIEPALQIAEGQASECRLQLEASIVEGNHVVQRPTNGQADGGEISINTQSDAVNFVASYLRAPLERLAHQSNCIEATLSPDSTFLHTGKKRNKKEEYDFRYDFRPRSNAPFVKKGYSHAPPTDLYGKQRPADATWGAYEPDEQAQAEEDKQANR